jgi:hypothetical protein
MAIWKPKPPESTEYFPLDLARNLSPDDSIVSATCAISVLKGIDPDTDAMLIDDVIIEQDTIVSQKVKGGIFGCRYQLTFTVNTSLGEVLKLSGDFFCGTLEPKVRDLTTLQAVRDWLGLNNEDHDHILQRLITAESERIEKAIQRPVLPEKRTDYITSYGGSTILLPASPIRSIDTLLIDGVPVSVEHDDISVWRVDGRQWPRNACIQVTYTAGFETVPYDLEQACIELVAFRYRERERIGHQSKSIAGETVSYITQAMPDSVKRAIAPYKRVAPC